MKNATRTEIHAGEIIRYWWRQPNRDPIEMVGRFTPERWEQFCKRPHPHMSNVTIEKIEDGR